MFSSLPQEVAQIKNFSFDPAANLLSDLDQAKFLSLKW